MENAIYYLELSKNPIRFDVASQLTSVFFDDTNKQIFAVRSGGATGIVVKGPTEDNVITFRMRDRGTICYIKFSPDNQILAIHRRKNAVDFIYFETNTESQLEKVFNYQSKSIIYGFVWIHKRECVLFSETGVEILHVTPEKSQVRSIKSYNISTNWFAWCPEANIAVLCTTDSNNTLLPIQFKQKTITRLPRIELNANRSDTDIQESRVTVCQIYGIMTVLLLEANAAGMMEMEVYQLNGPGLAPRKCHVLRLNLMGPFAVNIVDNLIVVHHQISATSLLFDLGLSGEVIDNVIYHKSITTPRSIKPFALKIPSLSPDGETMQCDLYSPDWVLFQPNVIIDAKLGCMWYLHLYIDAICTLISDRIRLTEFLLLRTNGKNSLLKVLQQLTSVQYNGSLLPVLETIFNKINKVYADWTKIELHNQIAQPSNIKATLRTVNSVMIPPKVFIDQNEMITHVLESIVDQQQCETILLLYLQSLNRYGLAAQEDLSKLIIVQLIKNKSFEVLHSLVHQALLLESKSVACFLLARSSESPIIIQMALDMLYKVKAYEIIIEVLLGQGKVIDALRVARNTFNDNNYRLSARKFLEAAVYTNNRLIYYSVFKFFQIRNLKLYGTTDFPKTDQCSEFIQFFESLNEQETSTPSTSSTTATTTEMT